MSTRKAPYSHADGSNCWTKNCSRNRKNNETIVNDIKKKEETINQILTTPGNSITPTIDLIAPWSQFEEAIAAGRISAGRHSQYPELRILKYSQATNFSRDWDELTSAARGLIVNTETGEILARPFSKFFNWNEPSAPVDLMRGPIEVSEKKDGSLGILYTNPDGEPEISTAGGLQSDQGVHATELYRRLYAGNWSPHPGYTYLFEIIYPQNRIVVDYGETDDLFLLGKVNKQTGRTVPLSQVKEWKWGRAEIYEGFGDLETITKSGERPNHEGYIIHYTDTDARVKYKHEEYVAMHRVMTGLNSRRIHELLANDQLQKFEFNMPEEFQEFVDTTAAKFRKEYDEIYLDAITQYENLRKSLPADVDKKTFALTVIDKKLGRLKQGLLFQLFDQGSISESGKKSIWESIKPAYERSFWATGTGNEEK